MISKDTEWFDISRGYEEWLQLFHQVFGTEMSEDFWRWKYRDVQKIGVALRKEGKLIAFYGGMPRNILLKGESMQAVQMGDVMVHPSERGAFTRKGSFWKVASSYIGSMVGEGNRYPIAFGFPNQRAYMLGKRLDLYDAVDSLVELSWETFPKVWFPLWRARKYKASDMYYVPKIWQKMKESLPHSILGVRDGQWLQERYLNHPDTPYTIISIYRYGSKKVHGIAVLRDRGEMGMECLDMFGDVKHVKKLWGAVFRYTQGKGYQRLFCWITQSHQRFFQPTQPQIQAIDIVIPFNVLTAGISPDDVRNRWWLMAGDTDFR